MWGGRWSRHSGLPEGLVQVVRHYVVVDSGTVEAVIKGGKGSSLIVSGSSPTIDARYGCSRQPVDPETRPAQDLAVRRDRPPLLGPAQGW
jgi:hypothetical protein